MMGDVFGVRPWEMAQMRVGELEACSKYLSERNSGG